MQTDRGEPDSPIEWFLIACDGDLVVKLAHGLTIGEDEKGDLILNPPQEAALLRISKEEALPVLQVLALDRTLSLPEGKSVQYLSLNTHIAVRVRLSSNTLSLSTSFAAAGRDPEYLDVSLVQAAQPAIVSERVAVVSEPTADGTMPVADDVIGPLPETEGPDAGFDIEIDDDDYRRTGIHGTQPSAEPTDSIGTITIGEVSAGEGAFDEVALDQRSTTDRSSPDSGPHGTPGGESPRIRRLVKLIVMTLIGVAAALVTIRTGD